MDKCLIVQPAGIGDILYIQKIVKKLSITHEVYLPIKDSISFIKDYLVTNNNIHLENTDTDNKIVLDGVSKRFPRKRIMEAKYAAVLIDPIDYINYIELERNIKKEEELFKLTENKEYRLICSFFGTPENDSGQGSYIKEIPESDKLHNVHLNYYPGYNIFDWIKVITNAKEIYTTDTCIMFLIEKYKCAATKLVAYSRRSTPCEIDYLFTKNWEYVC